MERCDILESMARTLFVTTFADACEDTEAFPHFNPEGQEPGCGGDWFDSVTDATPEACEIKAREIVEAFEAANKRRIEDAGQEWAELPGHHRAPTADRFGFYLTMQSLGHGVGLWDDVKEPAEGGFETPYTEFYAWDWINS